MVFTLRAGLTAQSTRQYKVKGGICDLGAQFFFNYSFIYLWLHWAFVALQELPLVAASGHYSFLGCTGFSLWWLLWCRAQALGARAWELVHEM